MTAQERVVEHLRSRALSGAYLDPTGTYRYLLWRRWNPHGPRLTWVGLNPSTADAATDDPTLRRLIGFTRDAGCGGLLLVNLYGYRATDPRGLATTHDPVGPDNDEAIIQAAKSAYQTVVCWGAHPLAAERAKHVLSLLHDSHVIPQCLGTTKDGSPRHPLYLPASTRLEPL